MVLPRIHFDYNPVRLHDPRQESVAAFQELLARSDASPWTADLMLPWLVAGTALAGALARRAEEAGGVERGPLMAPARALRSAIESVLARAADNTLATLEHDL